MKFTKHPDQLTLGKLIRLLEQCPPDATVRISHTHGPYINNQHSYRGYYEDLELQPSFESGYGDVAAFLAILKNNVLNRSFVGWKGGYNKMTADTPVWAGNWGDCDGIAVIGVQTRTDSYGEQAVVLLTAHTKD